jgi:hypothetical protein
VANARGHTSAAPGATASLSYDPCVTLAQFHLQCYSLLATRGGPALRKAVCPLLYLVMCAMLPSLADVVLVAIINAATHDARQSMYTYIYSPQQHATNGD